MNIILFRPAEIGLPLAIRDPRAAHILQVLRRGVGDTFDAGLLDGPRGKGTLRSIGTDALMLDFAWTEPPPPLAPIHLLIGLPRPQTARDLLRDLTTLGVAAMHFVRTDRGEASYAQSTLWKTDEWRDCIINGAAQAFCTRLPEITHGQSLAEAIVRLPAEAARIALDNYESAGPLSGGDSISAKSAVLALGAERGWSAGERTTLREAGFVFADLGARVLRTETAAVAAATLLKAKLGRP